MKINRFRLALILLAVSAALIARPIVAAETTAAPANKPAAHSAVETLAQKKGWTVQRTFQTAAPALIGYVLKNATGSVTILYGVGDVVVSGTLLDANGNNLSEKYRQDYLPKPHYAKVAAELDDDKWLVIEGRPGAPVLYAFADPNCIFCHKLWEETRGWVSAGKLQIRWVMVAFLKNSSVGRAAAILAAKDRVKANDQDQQKFDPHTEEGAIPELSPIPGPIQEALKKHDAMMARLQFRGTPGLIFRDKDSHWQGLAGMPPKEKLAREMGLPL